MNLTLADLRAAAERVARRKLAEADERVPPGSKPGDKGSGFSDLPRVQAYRAAEMARAIAEIEAEMAIGGGSGEAGAARDGGLDKAGGSGEAPAGRDGGA